MIEMFENHAMTVFTFPHNWSLSLEQYLKPVRTVINQAKPVMQAVGIGFLVG